MHHLQAFALLVGQALARRQRVLEWGKHQGERRPELMAYVAEEKSFRAIYFRKRFGALPLLLICASISDRRGNLADDQIEKTLIVGVYNSPRTETTYEKTCWTGLTG